MRLVTAGAALLLFASCTSGLFADQALEPVEGAEVLQLQDALRQAAREQATFYIENSRYATSTAELGYTPPEEITITITPQAAEGFCISGTHRSLEDVVWHVTAEQTVPVEGSC